MCKLYLVSLEEFDGDWGLTGFALVRWVELSTLLVSGALYLGWFWLRWGDYCLSKTRTWVNCLPAPLMPVMVTVIVLPRWVKTVRPVAR